MTPRQYSDPPFIVFSDDWGVHPSSSQHIFKFLLPDHKVAWLNTVGMRRPTLTRHDFGKAVSKLSAMFRRGGRSEAVAKAPAPLVLQPKMIPFNDIGAIRRWNFRSVRKSLLTLAAEPLLQDPVIVTTVPNACDYVDAIPNRRIVYYCVDDFSEWPGLDKDLVLDMERDLIAKSDVFIATSESLYERLAATGKPTFLLSHGVDLELFGSRADEEHDSLLAIPKPRAGYFGLFDARSDQSLLLDVASRCPDISFVITGRVEVDISALQAMKNVFFTGPIDYERLPELVKGLDVLFIPYEVNKLTEALSPLKFKEYLATGKPVLSTPIQAAGEFRSFIAIESDAAAWEKAIRESLLATDGSSNANLMEWLESETWQGKARQFVEYCARDGEMV